MSLEVFPPLIFFVFFVVFFFLSLNTLGLYFSISHAPDFPCLPSGILGAVRSPGWEQGDPGLYHSCHCRVRDHRRPGHHHHVCDCRDPECREQRDIRRPQVWGWQPSWGLLDRETFTVAWWTLEMLPNIQKYGYAFLFRKDVQVGEMDHVIQISAQLQTELCSSFAFHSLHPVCSNFFFSFLFLTNPRN